MITWISLLKSVKPIYHDFKDVTAIDDIIKDVKSSNAVNDIELLLVEVAESLDKVIKHRKDNHTSLKAQRTRIENESNKQA